MGAMNAPKPPMKKVNPYPKADFRRTLSVLGAIDTPTGATLVQIVESTGLDKKTITYLIAQASIQLAINITKTGPVYRIVDWGPVIKPAGAKLALTGALNAPKIASTDS